MRERTGEGHWKRWLAIGVAAVALAVVGGPYVYIHFVEGKAPPPLAFASPSPAAGSGTTSTAQSGTTDGTWTLDGDSIVGYRVKEILFGQSNEAVGRTSAITGSMSVDGSTITAATFTVDMRSVTSDESRRDGQFNGRIMETATYPTATFTLTQPIELASIPGDGATITAEATGELSLHGVTKTVTLEITGRYLSGTVQVVGSIPITFADWGIPNPTFGPVQTEDHGQLEFALNFSHG